MPHRPSKALNRPNGATFFRFFATAQSAVFHQKTNFSEVIDKRNDVVYNAFVNFF
jgi:hypothetical protein